MKRIAKITIILLLSSLITKAQTIEWQKCFGGSDGDYASFISQTNDGGYIVAGSSESIDGDVSGNHGAFDYWLVKLNAMGDTIWTKSLGGSHEDGANTIKQTSDSGYIIAGHSQSTNGDVSENHGNEDYWIVKLNSIGDTLWTKSLGGSDNDRAMCINQTNDDGYIIAGYSYSNDGDVSGNHGISDYWIVKLNATGDIVWTKSLGGSDSDSANSISQTTDDGYIIAGYSYSNDGDVSGNHGTSDYWIVKLNATGDIVWTKSLGGSGGDYANSINQTTDGGYIVAGYSNSIDGDVSGNHGTSDYWIVKLNATGDIVWTKSLGGSDDDRAYFINQTNDGEYIISGYSYSNNGDVSGNHGLNDYWIVKLNTIGDSLWTKSLGGSGYDRAYSISQTTNGGYIITGYSLSTDGDINENHGNSDYWIIKLYPDSSTSVSKIIKKKLFTLYPNPAKNNVQLVMSNAQLNKNTNVFIYDVYGHEVGRVFLLDNKATINVEHFPRGIYFVRIGGFSKKFVKM